MICQFWRVFKNYVDMEISYVEKLNFKKLNILLEQFRMNFFLIKRKWYIIELKWFINYIPNSESPRNILLE